MHPKRFLCWIRSAAGLALILTFFVHDVSAKRPQILPESMLINLFALTEASAAMQICADSSAFAGLPADQKALSLRLRHTVDDLVRKIARKFDEDLFPFFVKSRNEAAARPDKINEMRIRYEYCGNGFLERMKGYIYDSRQKLDFFLSQQPDAR
jgi:hypothetical protein